MSEYTTQLHWQCNEGEASNDQRHSRHHTLRFDGSPPDAAALVARHHGAHEQCFIANSVKTKVRVEPRA